MSDASPLPLRLCGPCVACCRWLQIDKPEIRKASGVPCRHLVEARGCAIHAARPAICREWFCGWRQSAFFPEALRPDQSGVIVLMDEPAPARPGEEPGAALCLLLIAPVERVLNGPFVELVSRLLGAAVPVLLGLPGPPGATGARVLVNNHARSVADGQGLADLLRALAADLQASRFSPERYAHAGPDFGAESRA